MTLIHAPLRTPAAELLSRRLGLLARLTASDRDRLAALPTARQSYAMGERLSDGESEAAPRVIVSGWAGRVRSLPDGRRQVVGIVLPGDAIELDAAPISAGCDFVALTRVETIDAQALAAERLTAPAFAGLAAALKAAAALDARLQVDQVVRLGRLTALERTASFLLELRWRLACVGLASDRRMPMPLTQEMLGDTLGLSTVHVNRMLQELRRESLLTLRSGVANFPDLERLQELAGWRAPLDVTLAPTSSHRAHLGGQTVVA